MHKKFIKLLLLSFIIPLLLIGCENNDTKDDTNTSNNNNTNNVAKNNNDNEQPNYEEKNVYADFLKLKVGTEAFFHGAVEYGHIMTVEDVIEKEKSKTFVTKIVEDDLSGLGNHNIFYVNYEVTSDGISMTIVPEKEISHISFGIINEKRLITPQQRVGESFTQLVTINNHEYTLNSKIIAMDEENITIYAYIDNIEGFKDNKYEEKTVINSELGIIEHSHTLPLYEDENGELQDYGFDFFFEHTNFNFEY